ncbi:MAG TPA: hypothetical protein VFG21_07110 [Xanthomonadaceae bacterium]|nr:hypothetical protein [Xanthomonadaceae bacterium]
MIPIQQQPASGLRQRGITTLLVAILLLGILTVVVFFSTSVGIFEQRTATNEHRAKLTQQIAEASVNMAVEFLKANGALLTSTDPVVNGWLAAGTERWVPCTTAAPSGQFDPCTAIPDTPNALRDQMYRYEFGGSTLVPYNAAVPANAQIDSITIGGTVAAPVTAAATAEVAAVLCRFDVNDPDLPECDLDPEDPGMIAITLVSNTDVATENASAQIKETVGTFRTFGGADAVPLVASGTVNGLGNAEIVANPNAGGFGVPGSIWAPGQVNIEGSGGGGIGSVITCHMGEFLQGNDVDDLFTTCTGNACGCPTLNNGALSGSAQGNQIEGIDVLDIDGGHGLPDIAYFPSHKVSPVSGLQLDVQDDHLDDSLFEFFFSQDVVDGTGAPGASQPDVSQNCGDGGNGDCAIAALQSLGALETDCTDLSAASTGLYWARNGCNLPAVVGSATAPVVLVVEDDLHLQGNTIFYGMIFVRSSTNTGTFRGNGNMTIFGTTIIEGNIDTNGSIRYVYSEKIAQAINNSPAFQRFGRVPGSWLDAPTAF